MYIEKWNATSEFQMIVIFLFINRNSKFCNGFLKLDQKEHFAKIGTKLLSFSDFCFSAIGASMHLNRVV